MLKSPRMTRVVETMSKPSVRVFMDTDYIYKEIDDYIQGYRLCIKRDVGR